MSGFFNIKIGEPSTKETNPLTTFDAENQSLFPNLTYKERLMGFALCVGLGIFLEILSFGAFAGILVGKPEKFAIMYSLGNLLAIVGTSFLTGFKKQFQNMIDKERLFSTIIFVVSLIMTLVSAFVLKQPILCLIFIITQFLAYVWYSASYIPFARSCIKNTLKKLIGQ